MEPALAVTRAEGKRYIVAGLGARNEFDPEKARVAAAGALGRAKELGTRTLCWEVPHHVDDAHVGALVEGTLLADYTFTKYKEPAKDGIDVPSMPFLIVRNSPASSPPNCPDR